MNAIWMNLQTTISFEEHEDAPGIPDLQAGLNSPTKLIEGKSRGSSTILKHMSGSVKYIAISVHTEWH